MMGETPLSPGSRCPHCAMPLLSAKDHEDSLAVARPGDWVICAGCLSPLELDATLRPLALSLDRLRGALADPEYAELLERKQGIARRSRAAHRALRN